MADSTVSASTGSEPTELDRDTCEHRRRLGRETRTGAAFTRFVVNVPAPTVG